MGHVNLGTSVIQHSSLTGGLLEGISGSAPATALQNFLTPGPGSIFELQATTFSGRFPSITEQLNTNFQNIQTSFENLGEKVATKTTGTPGTAREEVPGGPTAPGFDFGKSFGEGLGGVGDFLSENPAVLVGILGVVALLVLKR